MQPVRNPEIIFNDEFDDMMETERQKKIKKPPSEERGVLVVNPIPPATPAPVANITDDLSVEKIFFFSLCSSSTFYLVNYKIQSIIYNWFDEITEETECSRLQGIGIWCASSTITVVLRIAAIAEVFFNGTCIVLWSLCVENSLDNAVSGLYEIFIHTTKNILRTAVFPLEFLDGVIFTLVEPKDRIMEIAEYMRINLLHAEEGTIHSRKHIVDLCPSCERA